jgi:hypothetical protein
MEVENLVYNHVLRFEVIDDVGKDRQDRDWIISEVVLRQCGGSGTALVAFVNGAVGIIFRRDVQWNAAN